MIPENLVQKTMNCPHFCKHLMSPTAMSFQILFLGQGPKGLISDPELYTTRVKSSGFRVDHGPTSVIVSTTKPAKKHNLNQQLAGSSKTYICARKAGHAYGVGRRGGEGRVGGGGGKLEAARRGRMGRGGGKGGVGKEDREGSSQRPLLP